MGYRKESMPLVSVVVPAFNAVETIEETLASVSRQTFRNIEIIVVDDGSTDSTAELVSTVAKTDPRIRLVTKRNGGPASARNAGIATSKGQFVAPMDSDDIWHPMKLELQVQYLLRAGEEFGVVYSPCRLLNKQSNVIKSLPIYKVNGSAFFQLCYYNFTQNGSSMLFRRSAYDEVGGYNEDVRVVGTEDKLFAAELAARSKVGCVDKYLIGYRQSQTSLSRNSLNMYLANIETIRILRSEWPGFNRKFVFWCTNPSRVRLIYQTTVEQGWTVASIKLLLVSLVRDPIATVYSIWKCLKLKIFEEQNQYAVFKQFREYEIDDQQGADIAFYMKIRLGRLSRQDQRANRKIKTIRSIGRQQVRGI